jgi:integrase
VSRARPRLISRGSPSPRDPGLSVEQRAAALSAGLSPPFAATIFHVTDPALKGTFNDRRLKTVDTSSLPVPMQQELSWWVASCHASGQLRLDAARWRGWVGLASQVAAEGPPRHPRGVTSFSQLSLQEWMAAWASDFYARYGRMPAAESRYYTELSLRHLLDALAIAYSPLEWWRHDRWDPAVDSRIPRRDHEPQGTRRISFSGFSRSWLAEAAKFYLHVQLDTGRLTWSTAISQRDFLAGQLDAYLAHRGIDHPALCANPGTELRGIALDLVSFLRQWSPRRSGSASSGRTALTTGTLAKCQQAIASFYAFMADYKAEAAAALDDRRWLDLTDAHARLWRPEESLRKGRSLPAADDRNYIDDADLAAMFGCIELLGSPRREAHAVVVGGRRLGLSGLGDPSAMRAWILQALTGRRASEILMMDFEPLSNIPGLDPAKAPEGAMVARLRYRQTKIEGAPDTILVGADVVGVVREQQEWVRQQFGLGEDERTPYLFPRLRGNQRLDRPRTVGSYQAQLCALDRLVRLTDGHGRPLSFSRSHRLRHTKATTLLNLGVPVHVVQRYMGHLSPEMVMHYGATLAATAEREFLALAKIGRDGRELAMDRQDLLDLVSLERRTDRILPNGYCLLPPTKSCEKGNACHTCDHFATDRSYLLEIRRQLAETEALVAVRKEQHLARHGEPMSDSNVWLSQRVAEMEAMRREICALEAQPDYGGGAVRGAGVLARPAYQAGPVPVTLSATRVKEAP